jgi:hypothetical protein
MIINQKDTLIWYLNSIKLEQNITEGETKNIKVHQRGK